MLGLGPCHHRKCENPPVCNTDKPWGQVYHPNIDLEGNVCLNILREDWKPVLSINSVIYGLQFLFLVRSCCRAPVPSALPKNLRVHLTWLTVCHWVNRQP